MCEELVAGRQIEARFDKNLRPRMEARAGDGLKEKLSRHGCQEGF